MDNRYEVSNPNEETLLLSGGVDSDDVEYLLHSDVKAAATVPASIFNLSNTIVGAGMLSLPFAMKNTGIVLGPLILVFTYVLIIASCTLLITCSRYSAGKSYRAVAEAAFGKLGMLATDIAVVIACFGAMTSYLVIVGDMISPLIAQWMGGTEDDLCSAWANRRIPISFSLLIVSPLSLLESIDSLKYTSYLALISVTYLVVVVVLRSGESLNEGPDMDIDFMNVSESIFRAVPILTLAFTCQMNLFSLLTELKNPTRKRVRAVVYGAVSACLCIYLVIGIFGYLTFYKDVAGNILLNYKVDDDYVMIGRLAVGLVVIFSFPLMAHPCLATLDNLCFPHKEFPSYTRRGFLAFWVIGIAFCIAMLVDDVSVVLGIAGSTGSTFVSFILPSLFFLRLDPRPIKSAKKIMAVGLLLLGIVFFVTSTVVTLIDAADSTDDVELATKCPR